MGKTINDEISQNAFRDPYEKLVVSTLYSGLFLKEAINSILRPHKINMVHYNILRIIRGQRGDFVPLKIIKDVLIDRSVNLSRSVDHLVKQGFLEREARKSDRREIKVKMMDSGLALLEAIQPYMDQRMGRIAEMLPSDQAEKASLALDQIREAYRLPSLLNAVQGERT